MTTYFTGVNGKIQFFDGTNYSSIGAVDEFTKTFRVRTTQTDGIATRKRYNHRITEVVPSFNLRYVPQDFNLLTDYLIKDDEGTLTKFHLRYYDGQQYGEVYNIASDSVEVGTQHGQVVRVTCAGIAENTSIGIETCSWESVSANEPAYWRDTNLLKVFGTDVKAAFREWSFRVNNNAYPDVTGNVIRPASVHWGKADYTGRIDLAKSMGSFEGNILNASKASIQYGLTVGDVTKIFTFEISDLTQGEVRLPMDLIVHRVEWRSQSLNISTV